MLSAYSSVDQAHLDICDFFVLLLNSFDDVLSCWGRLLPAGSIVPTRQSFLL